MIKCEKCGFENANGSNFCGNCGWNLVQKKQEMPQVSVQKKNEKNLLLIPTILIVAAIIIIAVVLLSKKWLPDKDTGKGNDTPGVQQEEQLSQEDVSQEVEEEKVTNNNIENTEDELKEDDVENQVDYSDVELNAVDNAYVWVDGTIATKQGELILELPRGLSACAYNGNNEIIEKTNVKWIVFAEADDLESYIGAEVSIKGKLSVNVLEELELKIVNLDITKEAPSEEIVQTEHRYNLILRDCTWQEAFTDCVNRGGYLVQINSEEEMQTIIEMIEEADMQDVHFYLGGRRDEMDSEYFWVDSYDEFVYTMLNPEGNSWASDYWMENEPSFWAGDVPEMYMNLIYYKEKWVLNDVPADITMYYPGKTGYICEYDE